MPFLELKNITKKFNSIAALSEVTISFEKGEIHAICGENGAGKSTLIKIMSGVYPASSYEGTIKINDEIQKFTGIKDAENAGVVVIHQELALVKELSIAENIFLGDEPSYLGIINKNKMLSETKVLLEKVGLSVSPQTKITELGIGTQQLVEIAKAFRKKAKILILDEPTTALTEKEVEKLLNIIRDLKQQGVTCIYISHKLNEVMTLSDRISVMRDGKHVITQKTSEVTEHKLVNQMVGREINDLYPPTGSSKGDTVLKISNFNLYDTIDAQKKKVANINFDVKAGEVLGIAGLMGSGRTELLNGIFGNWTGLREGEIELDNKQVTISSPLEAIKHGIALVTEDRKRYGLVLESSVGKNLSLSTLKKIASAFGIINEKKEQNSTKNNIQKLRIKTGGPDVIVNTLSGGNQQKVVIGKWLETEPKILLMDEPTRGIDVGAKSEIYDLIRTLTSRGMAVIMVSSDLPEVIGMSDRIIVLHEGKITAEIPAQTATQEQIMLAATGQKTGSTFKV